MRRLGGREHREEIRVPRRVHPRPPRMRRLKPLSVIIFSHGPIELRTAVKVICRADYALISAENQGSGSLNVKCPEAVCWSDVAIDSLIPHLVDTIPHTSHSDESLIFVKHRSR